MYLHSLVYGIAYGKPWIKRRKRILENDLHILPSLSQLLCPEAADVLTIKNDLSRSRLYKPQQASAESGLATAGLSYQSHCLPSPYIKTDAIHRSEIFLRFFSQAFLYRKPYMQIMRFQQNPGMRFPG